MGTTVQMRHDRLKPALWSQAEGYYHLQSIGELVAICGALGYWRSVISNPGVADDTTRAFIGSTIWKVEPGKVCSL